MCTLVDYCTPFSDFVLDKEISDQSKYQYYFPKHSHFKYVKHFNKTTLKIPLKLLNVRINYKRSAFNNMLHVIFAGRWACCQQRSQWTPQGEERSAGQTWLGKLQSRYSTRQYWLASNKLYNMILRSEFRPIIYRANFVQSYYRANFTQSYYWASFPQSYYRANFTQSYYQ